MSNDGNIFLVRHGEAAATWGEDADPRLSEAGQRQAEATAESLYSRLVGLEATLQSSPLRRAQETAEPLASLLAQSVRLDERFREIPAPVPLEQRQDWLSGFMRQTWSDQDGDIVTWRDAMMAGVGALPVNSVVFTHFLVINAVVGQLRAQDNTLVFWPANASITVLDRRNGRLSVAALGEEMRSRVN